MSSYRITPGALRDLEGIYYYIAIEKEAPSNAKKFIRRLYKSFAFLGENPKAGRSKSYIRQGFMVWTEGKYYIFYEMTSQGVDIIRVINCSQDLEKLFS